MSLIPNSGLEALHPEIQELIISHLPTVQSLHSLIRASPRFYQVFRSHKKIALSRLLRRQFHAAVLSDALTVVQASQLERPRTRENVVAFLQGFPLKPERVESATSISLPDCIALCQLYRKLNFFINDLHQRSTVLLIQRSPRKVNNPPERLAMNTVLRSPLSDVEAGRLQRAFCRFETFRLLFSSPHSTESPLTVPEQAQMFLEAFADWEIEEIACVRDYLVRRLSQVFDQLEDEFVLGVRTGTVGWRRRTLPDKWDSQHHWFSVSAKDDHASYMETLLSLGLPFLRQVFQSVGEKRKALVIHNSENKGNFLTAALTKPNKREFAIREYSDAHRSGLMPVFNGDTLQGCNGGWMWGHAYCLRLMWAEGIMRGLRDWGYVFWDMERLESSGFLDME